MKMYPSIDSGGPPYYSTLCIQWWAPLLLHLMHRYYTVDPLLLQLIHKYYTMESGLCINIIQWWALSILQLLKILFQYCEGIFSEITQSPDRFLAKKSENCIILNGAVQTVLKKIYIWKKVIMETYYQNAQCMQCNTLMLPVTWMYFFFQLLGYTFFFWGKDKC